MSLTGLRPDSGIATIDADGPVAAAVVSARGGMRRDAEDEGDEQTLGAVDATCSWLLGRQHADGHWRGPLEGDTILESEYILILTWAGRLGQPEIAGAARRILKEQLPGGGWAIHPGGPVDVSASVKAYFALKITGHDPESEPLRRARRAIDQAGGPWAVNSFTRFYLALLGQVSYDDCPAVPPEMVLLPDWFPVNLSRVSAWSRTMIVPLSLIWACKPVRRIPAESGIAELFPPSGERPRRVASGGWDLFFHGVDRLLKACDAVGIRPLRRRAVAACRRWMLERFDGSDGLGAIFPPIVWSIVALRAMGCADDSPEVEECCGSSAGWSSRRTTVPSGSSPAALPSGTRRCRCGPSRTPGRPCGRRVSCWRPVSGGPSGWTARWRRPSTGSSTARSARGAIGRGRARRSSPPAGASSTPTASIPTSTTPRWC
jgi:hypothetical protein